MSKHITTREEDFSKWYHDVVRSADLAENAPVRGCMIIKPHGFAIWERLKNALDTEIKATGAQNVYFPLFIPKSFLEKEADHVEGFAPEVAVVTHGGGKELEEPLIVRPTSETIINHTFSNWVSSWRDLPLMINQWANVVRWELRPRLFLRTTEFLWQEGHTAHATAEEAAAETARMLGVYKSVVEGVLAVSLQDGEKTAAERFAGADATYTIEAMMQNGWALQCGTSHNLGQNFAKAFDIQFQDTDGERKHVWQTSWGVSTRLIGALVMSHSDDKGLVLPPAVAPQQVVLVPIFRKDPEQNAALVAAAQKLKDAMPDGVRFHIDDRDNMKPGAKFYEWEKKGAPIRLELGPRDLEGSQVMLARRDTSEKSAVSFDDLPGQIVPLLDEIQSGLLERSRKFREDNTIPVDSMDALREVIEREPFAGWAVADWSGSGELEKKIREDTKATIRCVLEHYDDPAGRTCVASGEPATQRVVFARNY